MFIAFLKSLIVSFVSMFILNQLLFGASGLLYNVSYNTWHINLDRLLLVALILHIFVFWPTLQAKFLVYWLNRFGIGGYLNVGLYVVHYTAFMLSFWFSPVVAKAFMLTKEMKLPLSLVFYRATWQDNREVIVGQLMFLLLYGLLMYFILGIHRREE